jgi:hypothetical protein
MRIQEHQTSSDGSDACVAGKGRASIRHISASAKPRGYAAIPSGAATRSGTHSIDRTVKELFESVSGSISTLAVVRAAFAHELLRPWIRLLLQNIEVTDQIRVAITLDRP